MALCAGPWFRPVSETRKKGGGEETEQRKRGLGLFSRSPGLLEVQEEPLINYDHYNHHLSQGH